MVMTQIDFRVTLNKAYTQTCNNKTQRREQALAPSAPGFQSFARLLQKNGWRSFVLIEPADHRRFNTDI